MRVSKETQIMISEKVEISRTLSRTFLKINNRMSFKTTTVTYWVWFIQYAASFFDQTDIQTNSNQDYLYLSFIWNVRGPLTVHVVCLSRDLKNRDATVKITSTSKSFPINPEKTELNPAHGYLLITFLQFYEHLHDIILVLMLWYFHIFVFLLVGNILNLVMIEKNRSAATIGIFSNNNTNIEPPVFI